jgi:hypothetical protein
MIRKIFLLLAVFAFMITMSSVNVRATVQASSKVSISDVGTKAADSQITAQNNSTALIYCSVANTLKNEEMIQATNDQGEQSMMAQTTEKADKATNLATTTQANDTFNIAAAILKCPITNVVARTNAGIAMAACVV